MFKLSLSQPYSQSFSSSGGWTTPPPPPLWKILLILEWSYFLSMFEHLFYLFARIRKAPRLGLPEFWARGLQWTGLKNCDMPSFEPTWILFDYSFDKSGIFNPKQWVACRNNVKTKFLPRPGWVRIFGWSYWGIHILKKSIFDLLTFLQGRIQKFKIFIGWVDTFLRTLFLCAGSPGVLLFWAILCLSSHSYTIVSLL